MFSGGRNHTQKASKTPIPSTSNHSLVYLVNCKSGVVVIMNSVVVNQEVTVSGVYFKNKGEIEAYPKQMEFAGQTYTFLNSGWRYLVHKGQEVVKIFSVTDGTSDYRIKLDPSESHWTLLEIKSAI